MSIWRIILPKLLFAYFYVNNSSDWSFFQHVDLENSFLCGYLKIKGLTNEYPTLTTYFDGEIISQKHPFLTRKWEADEDVDKKHWVRDRNICLHLPFQIQVSRTWIFRHHTIRICWLHVYSPWMVVLNVASMTFSGGKKFTKETEGGKSKSDRKKSKGPMGQKKYSTKCSLWL